MINLRSIKNFCGKIGVKEYLKNILYFFEDIFDKNILMRNKCLDNIHFEKRCFLFGTGLSVNDVDLSLLSDEYTFAVAGMHKHQEFYRLNLKFFVMISNHFLIKVEASRVVYVNPYIYYEDDSNVWMNTEKPLTSFTIEPKYLFRELDGCLNTNAFVFLNAMSQRFVKRNRIFENKKVFYLRPLCNILSADQQKIDLTDRVTFLDGSIFQMMGIAMYMGFKEIYLIGNDYTFSPAQQFHFYDPLMFSKKLPKETAMKLIYDIAVAREAGVLKIEEDEGFYKPIYVKYQIPTQYEHWAIKHFAESIGVKIYNIVPKGFESPIYEKISWEEVASKVLINK